MVITGSPSPRSQPLRGCSPSSVRTPESLRSYRRVAPLADSSSSASVSRQRSVPADRNCALSVSP